MLYIHKTLCKYKILTYKYMKHIFRTHSIQKNFSVCVLYIEPHTTFYIQPACFHKVLNLYVQILYISINRTQFCNT